VPDPIDPAAGDKVALEGRLVTMDGDFTVHDPGVLYVDAGRIVEARAAGDDAPEGFEDVARVDVQGTPG